VDSSTGDRKLTAASEQELQRVAATIARNLAPGDRIALIGDLGAGKTVFVRGLARGLGHPEPRDVVSPTFAIHHRYEGGRITLDHLDLYRLAAPVSLEREGLDTVVSDLTTVLCCEWPDRLARPLPGLVLEVRLGLLDPETRSIHLRAAPPAAGRLLAGLP
jgi:tRNA threonylcarbamoyl adenosine modification protein YjeE